MFIHLLMLPFTIAFSLLRLPFTLLHMAFGMLGISTRIFLWPLKVFARHTVLCLVVIAALILYFAIKKDPGKIDRAIDQAKTIDVTPDNPSNPAKNNKTPIIEPISKHENGDSRFSTDLYASMTDAERKEYSQHFYVAMSTMLDKTPYTWKFYNIAGTLNPTTTFKNKMGDTCRSFTETLKVHRIEQTISGTACTKPSGGWCKLKPGATPACGLGHNPGLLDGIGASLKRLF